MGLGLSLKDGKYALPTDTTLMKNWGIQAGYLTEDEEGNLSLTQ